MLDGIPDNLPNASQLLTSAQGYQLKGRQVLWGRTCEKAGSTRCQVPLACALKHKNRVSQLSERVSPLLDTQPGLL